MSAWPMAAQDGARITVDVKLVNVPFSVRDEKGRLVDGLTRDDIEVFEDGVPQKITHFSQSADSPLALALVSDVSGSQDEFLKDHRRDLLDFLKGNILILLFVIGCGAAAQSISDQDRAYLTSHLE
ncbi:MAG: hypothetical protein FJW30_16295, partial [Acidobacteria bacterium]|nr:hypothetical protein [Acidobacteriota bacterium]